MAKIKASKFLPKAAQASERKAAAQLLGLTDFIREQLTLRDGINGGRRGNMGYAEWIAKSGEHPSEARSLTGAAMTEYEMARTGYGRRAVSLAEAGLSDSGYAEYLEKMAKEERDGAVAMAKSLHGSALASGKRGYAEYLDAAREEGKSLYESTLKKLVSEKFTDERAAYDRARELGLDGERAYEAAQLATGEVVRELKIKVMSAISTKRLTAYQAKLYAASIGLGKDDAEQLASYAYSVNESADINGGSESFLEYLRELYEKQNQN